MVMCVSTAGMVGRGRVSDPLGIAGSSLANIYGYANGPLAKPDELSLAEQTKRRAIKAEKVRKHRKARKEVKRG